MEAMVSIMEATMATIMEVIMAEIKKTRKKVSRIQ